MLESILDNLSKVDLNSHQIKNTICIINILTKLTNSFFDKEDIKIILKIIKEFKADFNNIIDAVIS